MLCFPNAKINLGLNVIQKRSDGFHDLETVFYPIGWRDALEIIVCNTISDSDFNIHLSGIPIIGALNDNLLYKAYHLIKAITPVPSINVYLHKNIPMGAGLGGGSADAAFFINALNNQFELNLSLEQRLTIAKSLGSDCAFFIENNPVFAAQKGDVFEPIFLNLSAYHLVVVYPNINSNTKDAYSLVTPKKPQAPVTEILKLPIEQWRKLLVNDFEDSIFTKYPLVQSVKETLYKHGASYASMSGSGSAVFGIFKTEINLESVFNFPMWAGKMI